MQVRGAGVSIPRHEAVTFKHGRGGELDAGEKKKKEKKKEKKSLSSGVFKVGCMVHKFGRSCIIIVIIVIILSSSFI